MGRLGPNYCKDCNKKGHGIKKRSHMLDMVGFVEFLEFHKTF